MSFITSLAFIKGLLLIILKASNMQVAYFVFIVKDNSP
ncbi:hypothetical protein P278_10010 [Zhouia amylolytica AD3]|uniref:Uncharacterized protein n=1 Tax=Zhouia amylolytica AD3 TaxID=1286632 RepID=W2UMW3_9FLAO|nr:hypothetical protein P278_10010 [Zhouia amylolytica AD3]